MKTKTLTMLKGLPGCGKSTAAKAYRENYPDTVTVNKDLLRLMMLHGPWTPAKEKVILHSRDVLVNQMLLEGKNVIVDDTNLHPKHEIRLREIAKARGANFKVIDLSFITPEVCIERDLLREKSVGTRVITDMYMRFIFKPRPAPEYDPGLPSCVICDIDGTIANRVNRGPYEEDKVLDDQPRDVVIKVVQRLYTDTKIFLSGRTEGCREDTAKWLALHAPMNTWKLFMRPVADVRKDFIVKREIYENEILGKYNVMAIFDDRAQVCRMWRDIGLGGVLFRVGEVDRDDF